MTWPPRGRGETADNVGGRGYSRQGKEAQPEPEGSKAVQVQMGNGGECKREKRRARRGRRWSGKKARHQGGQSLAGGERRCQESRRQPAQRRNGKIGRVCKGPATAERLGRKWREWVKRREERPQCNEPSATLFYQLIEAKSAAELADRSNRCIKSLEPHPELITINTADKETQTVNQRERRKEK